MANSELFIIKEGKVFIPANQWCPERAIFEIKDNNTEAAIAHLREQYKPIEADLQAIETGLQETGEILKQVGFINRTRNNLMKVKAIGDFEAAFARLDAWEEQLRLRTEAVIAEKEAICTQLEALTQEKDLKAATESLALLNKQFKALPISVPDPRNDSIAERIEKAITAFFALKQAKHDEYGQELLDNLSKKMDLCEQAEKIKDSTDWKKTTDTMLALMETWKSIGPVSKSRSEEIWLRFNEARDHFFKRKKEHVKEVKSEQEANLIEKEAIVAKAEALRDSKDWKKTSALYAELMEEWKKTGRVAPDKSEAIWQRFLEAKNHFFSRKEAFYSTLRNEQDNNLARKTSIVERAEQLINTNDFDGATQEFSQLMDDWKTSGRVAKEQGDALWDRFIAAKKQFFERKDAWRDERKQTLAAGLRDRIQRNRSFLNKISRDLHREEDLLFDLDDRLTNLPATLRSYEKREELNETKIEVTKNINELKKKVQEVKQKIQADEREMAFILRPPKKKTEAAPSEEAPAVLSSEADTMPTQDADTMPAQEAAASNVMQDESAPMPAVELPSENNEPMNPPNETEQESPL